MHSTALSVVEPTVQSGVQSWAPVWTEWVVPLRPRGGGGALGRKSARPIRLYPTYRPLRLREVGEPAVSLLKVLSVRAPSPMERTDGLGIDLQARGTEVRKLFYAAFARGLVKDGYDPEEVLQEVYRGLLARNLGKCPFDPKKSSFGHYVHIVARCVIANLIRKERRRAAHEIGESRLNRDALKERGAGFSIEESPDLRTGTRLEPGSLEELSRSISVTTHSNLEMVEGALRLLAEGQPRRAVCESLSVESAWLDRVLIEARSQLRR